MTLPIPILLKIFFLTATLYQEKQRTEFLTSDFYIIQLNFYKKKNKSEGIFISVTQHFIKIRNCKKKFVILTSRSYNQETLFYKFEGIL